MRWLLIILLSSVAAHAEPDMAMTAETPRPVVSQKVIIETTRKLSFVGTVAAHNETTLGFPFGGTMVERLVDLGDIVEKGEILARLDPEDLETNLRTAQANVLVANTQLSSAQEAQKRATELAARGVGAATRVETAERALVSAKARAEQAAASLVRARDNLDLSVLHAPLDGVVTAVLAQTGATLAPGQAILNLANTQGREVVMDLSEQDRAALTIGMEFDVSLSINPDIKATATLTRIDPVAESSTRTRRLHLELNDPPESFRFGALVDLRIQHTEEPVITLPFSAVLAPDDAPAIWVVDRADNRVSKRSITLGVRYGEQVRIEEGLQVGDEVILKGIHSLESGQIVGRSVQP